MCDISARMHCLGERRSKIGQCVTGKYANAMGVSNSIAAATARPTFSMYLTHWTYLHFLQALIPAGNRDRDLGAPNIGICGHCNTRADLAHLIWDCPLYSGTRQRAIAAIPPEWRPTSFQAWAQHGRITGAAANELWRSLLEYLDDPKASAVGTRLRLGRDSQNVNSRDAHWDCIFSLKGHKIRALQTCGKLFQRATPRAFVWFAARPESSEETCASLSPRFPPCATEPSDESYLAPSVGSTPAIAAFAPAAVIRPIMGATASAYIMSRRLRRHVIPLTDLSGCDQVL
ncbi:hypothetical protein HPB50_008910 [Hyalomma asiaticum]|uniref:Uncharacterized protein n=1 Tax=Hyalomma asiaticum TaxID=266040 RepID=A0ACB7SFN0_HYAAI|nr:hypothetical protein HPB50_008910 [Hyalomma asiaticum]